MTTVIFLGGEETGNVAYCDWGRFRFTIHQPVECNDPHIIAKASANRFFRVEGGGGKAEAAIVPDEPPPIIPVELLNDPIPEPVVKLDPLAKARAAKAAKREAGSAA